MTDTSTGRLARDLHPGAWWLWALGLAASASFTTNPLTLLLILSVATAVVLTCRSNHPWAGSFRVYVWLGVFIVAIRVLFRIIFPGNYPGTVIFELPTVPLPDFVLGITLLGPVTRETLLFGLYDGLRLATIVICVGAANSLANPKRLLRSVPPALYEIGTALVVAVTMLPQFADSARRVRAAQALRAGESGRIGRIRRFLIPVLEDALERSLALAAGMDTRGYGRAGDLSAARRRTTGVLMVVGLCGVCVGVYAGLDQTAPRWLATPMLLLGLALAGAGFVSAGRRVQRTIYRPDRWRTAEIAVAATGLSVGGVGYWISQHQVLIAYPDVAGFPEISLVALVGVLIGALALVAAPRPADRPTGRPTDPSPGHSTDRTTVTA